MMIMEVKSSEGYIIKTLSELLQNIVKVACFKITHEGIFLQMMDSRELILVDIALNSVNFNMFKLQEPIFIGLTSADLYRMLKTVKKKDSLYMYIDNLQPDNLMIVVYPKDNIRIVKSSVHIQNTQHICITPPTGYNSPIIIPSNEYQRSIKDVTNINSSMSVSMKTYSLTVMCSTDNIYSREILFGEFDDDTPVRYKETFDMDTFSRIMKVAGLGKNIKIYGQPGLPLRVSTSLGSLGTIDIYIKPKTKAE
jgi:proliferating cell nuclear antigen